MTDTQKSDDSPPDADRDATSWVMREPAERAEGEEANNPMGLLFLFGLLGFLWYSAGLASFLFVVGLILMIFLHELGHFLTARWTGMKSTQFFLGFGPRIWSFRRGEVEYGLRMIPAGAFVRIIGMNNLDPVDDPADEDRAYTNKSYPRRMLVITAGSMMHFIQAILLFILAVSVIGAEDPDSTWDIAAISRLETGEVPAIDAGLEPGDTIVSADGIATTNFNDLRDVLQPKANESVMLVVEKADGSITESTVTLVELERTDGSVVGFLGIAPSFDGRVRESPWVGVQEFGSAMKTGLTAIPRFLSPSSFANIGSLLFDGSADVDIRSDEAAERPISMVGAVRIAGGEDVDWLGRVVILAFINVFVGLVNLLPLLPLDGGHAAIATYERLRSFFTERPYQADVAKLLPITYGVVAVLAFLFLSTVYLDIFRPIG